MYQRISPQSNLLFFSIIVPTSPCILLPEEEPQPTHPESINLESIFGPAVADISFSFSSSIPDKIFDYPSDPPPPVPTSSSAIKNVARSPVSSTSVPTNDPDKSISAPHHVHFEEASINKALSFKSYPPTPNIDQTALICIQSQQQQQQKQHQHQQQQHLEIRFLEMLESSSVQAWNIIDEQKSTIRTLTAVNKAMEKRLDELEDAHSCVICRDRMRNVLFLPCRHCCVCRNCVQVGTQYVLRVCPICQIYVQHAVEITFP